VAPSGQVLGGVGSPSPIRPARAVAAGSLDDAQNNRIVRRL